MVNAILLHRDQELQCQQGENIPGQYKKGFAMQGHHLWETLLGYTQVLLPLALKAFNRDIHSQFKDHHPSEGYRFHIYMKYIARKYRLCVLGTVCSLKILAQASCDTQFREVKTGKFCLATKCSYTANSSSGRIPFFI